MSEVCYFVIGERGCYSDYEWWPVAAYVDKKKAERAVEELNDRVEEIKLHYDALLKPVHPYGNLSLPAGINPHDTNMPLYWGTDRVPSYSCSPVPALWKIGKGKENG